MREIVEDVVLESVLDDRPDAGQHGEHQRVAQERRDLRAPNDARDHQEEDHVCVEQQQLLDAAGDLECLI